MINSTTDIILSCKSDSGEEVRLTGEKAVCTKFTVNELSSTTSTIGGELFSAPEPVEINMTFLCKSKDFLHEWFDKDYKPKRRISQLRVDDCSIEELLFAIRQKVKKKEVKR